MIVAWTTTSYRSSNYPPRLVLIFVPTLYMPHINLKTPKWLSCAAISAFLYAQFFYPSSTSQGNTLICTQLNESHSSLQNRYEHLANYSHHADIWASVMLACSG